MPKPTASGTAGPPASLPGTPGPAPCPSWTAMRARVPSKRPGQVPQSGEGGEPSPVHPSAHTGKAHAP